MIVLKKSNLKGFKMHQCICIRGRLNFQIFPKLKEECLQPPNMERLLFMIIQYH